MTTERLAVWPGPMHVNRVIKEDRLYVSDAQGHRLAEVWGGINEDTDALARLFAAALELLAAARAAYEMSPFHEQSCEGLIEYEEGSIFDERVGCDCFLGKLKAAIFKAEGRDQ